MLRSHIQRVVPVRAAQADVPVCTGLVYRAKRLEQDVLKNRAGINRSGGRFLQNVLRPRRVLSHAAQILPVLKIRHGLEQHGKVARLVNIELCGQKRPHTVIHPDAADAVAVSDKFSGSGADNGRVRAVDADARKVLHDHAAHAVRLHQKQRQAVLPEVAPAAAAAAVVMVRQEGAAINSS